MRAGKQLRLTHSTKIKRNKKKRNSVTNQICINSTKQAAAKLKLFQAAAAGGYLVLEIMPCIPLGSGRILAMLTLKNQQIQQLLMTIYYYFGKQNHNTMTDVYECTHLMLHKHLGVAEVPPC